MIDGQVLFEHPLYAGEHVVPITSGESPRNYFPQKSTWNFNQDLEIKKAAAFNADSPLTSFEVQEKPAVAEVKVGVISILVHQFKQFRIQDLHKEKAVKG